MSADLEATVDRAWGMIPQTLSDAGQRGTFTRQRIERISEIAAGLGCLVLGVQGFVSALNDDAGELPGWGPAMVVVVFTLLGAMCFACLSGWGAKQLAGAFTLVYVMTLAVWPIATAGSSPSTTPEPWIWYLINVATVASVVAFRLPLQLLCTAGIPVLYGVVRILQGGFTPEFYLAILFEVPFALILGGVLLAMAWIFRRMASGVDEARSQAVAALAKAAEAQATHEERVAVSGLMHDSVMAALIAAERAETPRARALATSMAREALEGLADTGAPSSFAQPGPLTLDEIAVSLRASLADLGAHPPISVDGAKGAPAVPGDVALALLRAATQAASNSVQHAAGVGLRLEIARCPEVEPGVPSLRIRIQDRGPGFTLADVPDDRLGIRASILARVAAIDGTADIDSSSHGTIITLNWTAS